MQLENDKIRNYAEETIAEGKEQLKQRATQYRSDLESQAEKWKLQESDARKVEQAKLRTQADQRIRQVEPQHEAEKRDLKHQVQLLTMKQQTSSSGTTTL